MSSESERVHSLLESRIAENYRQRGFEVITDPDKSDVPFDLGMYQPDIVARRSDNEGYIIEVKGSLVKAPIDRYRDVADIVSQHPGWRFILVTSDDIAESGVPCVDDSLMTLDQLLRRRVHAERLLEQGDIEEAFLSLWTVLEATLRRRAAVVSIPIERFPTTSLIKHLYSQGELSMDLFDKVSALQSIRNRLVHGYQVPEIVDPAQQLKTLTAQLLTSWDPQPVGPSATNG